MREMPEGRFGDNGKRIMAFWGILFLAVIVRCIGFGSIPGGINQDEAMGAMDAWALSLYGTDRYGVRFPVHFEAWQIGQMSVLLAYCMIPFIKLLGFNIIAVRLPSLFISCIGVALVYLIGKRLFDGKFALGVMALAAITPWHFMQSRWSLDCNMFPHVFLLAFYLLLRGLEKRRFLYLSMIFFGLTFYCYGIAVYSVTPFLVVYAAWCLRKKQLKFREVLLCVLLFGVTALPEILVMAINLFHWDTIETPFFTMSHFPESIRGNDILFLNFSFAQLGRNLWAMIKCSFLQLPDHLFNALPAFGPLYHISIPFMTVGIVSFTRRLFGEKDGRRQTEMLALWGFWLTGIWVGMITYEVNINRINIIFYPLIFLCAYGIRETDRYVVSHVSHRCQVSQGGFVSGGIHGEASSKRQISEALDGEASSKRQISEAPNGDVSHSRQTNRRSRAGDSLDKYFPEGQRGKGFRKKTALPKAARPSGFMSVVTAAYALCFVLFLGTYFTSFRKDIETYFNVNFLEAVKAADSMEEYDRLYITGNMDWQYNLSMAEILTQYSCRIDARYYQELTHVTGGRELLPYSERYHFIDVNYLKEGDPEGLYLLHVSEPEKLPFEAETVREMGRYVLVRCGR